MNIKQPASLSNPNNTLRWAQSVYKAINAGISFAQPTGQDSSGVYNSFTPDNMSGVMLRVGGSGSSEPIKWAGANTSLVINHGLQRQPMGFIVTDKDTSCDVYRTATPTSDTITLACTVGTANITVFIF